MKSRLFSLSAALLLSGCTVGPNYKRPTVAVPGSYRGTISDEAARTKLAALGDQKWWDVFQDDQLRTLIRTALTQNYDSRIAASRVLEAQAQLGITRADQFPSVSAGAGISDTRNSQSTFLPAFETSTGQLNLAAAWELDFWGKYRRATEAARENLVASEWARREVLSTLVANVANAYFQLRALDLQLEISKRTLNSRQESLRLTRILADGGSTTLLDVRQAEQLVFTASAEIPVLEQQIEQQENFLSILLGQNPGDIPRGQTLTEQHQPPDVPDGLPSALLERRPDIQEAEAQLVAANAEIGVARAAYFSSNLIERRRRLPKFFIDQLVHGTGRGLEFRCFTNPTNLYRWPASLAGTPRGSAPANGCAVLPAIDSGCLSQRFRWPGGLPQDPRISHTTRTALQVRRGCGASFSHAVQRWCHRILGSLDQRNQRLLHGARPRPGAAQ
jgi:hypothetical protein